jgi:DNA integrity scanning protein DisA with diadenylate cyclase activity
MTAPPPPGPVERRIERLHHELVDEGIWLPPDEELLALLLAELDYARHPHAHEGVSPRYGALLAGADVLLQPDEQLETIDLRGIPLDVSRRLADGRSSFVARLTGRPDLLVCFERTREYETSAVELATATGTLIVQRSARGWIRLTTPHGVAVWDGIRWISKPLARVRAAELAARVPEADPAVLTNLLELCTHWLAAGRVGAALVWCLEGDPTALHGIGLQASVRIPTLDVNRRSHFAALLNALSQYDRAALVHPDGRIDRVAVHMRSSDRSRSELGPYRGTRHTSALRFSWDEPSTMVFVVSSSGTLAVFRRGALL